MMGQSKAHRRQLMKDEMVDGLKEFKEKLKEFFIVILFMFILTGIMFLPYLLTSTDAEISAFVSSLLGVK
jgi:hypothetical protein